MSGYGSPERLGRHAYIRHLRGHSDHEGEVQEVPVVRRLVTRKRESSRPSAMFRIELVRVMKGEDELNEAP